MNVLKEKCNDEALVQELKHGCIRAFGQLFDTYGKRLYSFALGYLKSPVEAEGVVQDVFTKVWEKKEDLRPEFSFKSYIFTIAFNFIKKVFIKRGRIRNYLSSEDNRYCVDFSTMDQIEYDFQFERLMDLVSRMPKRRRETFVKSRFEGLSVKEIAKEMKISPKTVENQITTALRFIRTNWDINQIEV